MMDLEGNRKIAGALTDKVAHHLGCVVGRGGDTQQLLSPGHGGVVDGLHIDVVTGHHDVTHLCVLLCICHLPTEGSSVAQLGRCRTLKSSCRIILLINKK